MKGTINKCDPVPYTQVTIDGGFWEERLRINRKAALPAQYTHCKNTGRIDAFRLNWTSGEPNPPHVFWDSDVAKWVEAASYSISAHPDARLEKKLNSVIDLICSAQQDDGYLNTHFTAVEPEKRWSNLRDCHELYCAGHLIEAAVAYYEATGRRNFLNVMCRYADYIGTVFGRERGKIRGYPGHEEIELALVKLYRATGTPAYLKLAKFFIDERGTSPHFFKKEAKKRGERSDKDKHQTYDYWQAHLPVREQKTAEGHAVRACYLYAGMADVAGETGDRGLLEACRSLWKNIVEKRMYIHGGIGSSRFEERFTLDYDLPNEEAYAETCAAIALVFFAHRMLQIDPSAEYADIIERALYNGIASGMSLDGKRFFYSNYLGSVPGTHRFTNQNAPVRREWFGCACCPSNLSRMFASISGYIYSLTDSAVFIHLFAESKASVRLQGCDVKLVQKTKYPWDETVRIEVNPDSPAEFTIAVRIPGWCTHARAAVNGSSVDIRPRVRKGYLRLRRSWKTGDSIELRFPMPVERVESHPSVRHNCGRIALQRGPVVYCLEEQDNEKDLSDILLGPNAEFNVYKPRSGTVKNIPVIRGKAFRRKTVTWKHNLYRSVPSGLKQCTITAIPYFMWANRGQGEMAVWIRQAEEKEVFSSYKALYL